MGRKRKAAPEMYWHKRAGQWVVKFGGQMVYLGKDEAAARERYKKELAAHLLGSEPAAPKTTTAPAKPKEAAPTVAAVLRAYAEARGSKVSPKQRARFRAALRAAVELYAELPAGHFTQEHLERVRDALLARDHKKNASLTRRLAELLANGPRPSKEVEAVLKAEGFNLPSVQKSRRTLGVVPKKVGKTWQMSLPPGGPPVPAEKRRLSRVYVNALVRVVQTAWKWAAGRRLVSEACARELGTLQPLARGEGGEEVPPVPPVEDATVLATLPHLGRVVRAMVEVELHSGARPGEVVVMRRRDISTSPAEKILVPGTRQHVAAVTTNGVTVWVYVPHSHKTLKREKVRIVCLGPKAQAVLAPFLVGRDPEAFLFSPAEADAEYREGSGKKQRAGSNRKPRARYTTDSYGQAVARGARRAKQPHWSPNQLRHRAATVIAAEHGQEGAQAVLGHSTPDMTSHYIANLVTKAAAVAAADG